jgi:LmbE family N-acetylglucosaminyl deacetylase
MQELAEESCHTDLLFIPRQDDLHRDHKVTAQAAMVKFRSANVLEYEIKDFRRSPFRPNVLVDLGLRSNNPIEFNGVSRVNLSFAEKKAFILEHAFRMMDPLDLPVMVQQAHTIGRMAFRASQSGTELDYAEAFMAEMII